jgi:hypothetical protein
MAEENSYLQYNDGFVLHNGLPVKWLSELGDTYDIILHFSQDWDSWNYTGFAAQYNNVHGDFEYVHSYKLLPNQGERGYFGKKAQLSRKRTSAVPTHLKYGANSAAMKAADPYSPAETFWFGSANNKPCSAVVFPYNTAPSADYYVGLNTTATSAIDFTNHGDEGMCEIVQMYVPDMTSLLWSLNTCNFSAVRNLYGPNVTNASAVFQTYDAEFTGRDTIKVLENIYLPKAAYMTSLGNLSAVKNVTAGMSARMYGDYEVDTFSGKTLVTVGNGSGTIKNVKANVSAISAIANGVTGNPLLFIDSNVNNISAFGFNAQRTSGSNVKCDLFNSSGSNIEHITTNSAYFNNSNLKFDRVSGTFKDEGGTNNITATVKVPYQTSAILSAGTTLSGSISGVGTVFLSGCDVTNCSMIEGQYINANTVTTESINSIYGRSNLRNVSATNITASIGQVALDNYALVGTNITADNLTINGSASLGGATLGNVNIQHYQYLDNTTFTSCIANSVYCNTGGCGFISGSIVNDFSGDSLAAKNSTMGNVYSRYASLTASTATGNIISHEGVYLTSGSSAYDISSNDYSVQLYNSTAHDITAVNFTANQNSLAHDVICKNSRFSGDSFNTLSASVSASAINGTYGDVTANSGFYCNRNTSGNSLYTQGRVRGSGFIDSITAHTVDSTVTYNHLTII